MTDFNPEDKMNYEQMEQLVTELDKLENELDDYKRSLEEYRSKNQPDMLLKPFKEEPKAVAPVVVASPPSINNASLKAIERQLDEMKLKLNKLDEFESKLGILDDMDEELRAMKHFIEERLRVDFEAMYQNLLEQMNIEAIKVYRNIQAVIVEEDAKQNHVLFGVDGKSDKLRKRLNHMMFLAIVSFVVSILVMLMQILPALGVHLF